MAFNITTSGLKMTDNFVSQKLSNHSAPYLTLSLAYLEDFPLSLVFCSTSLIVSKAAKNPPVMREIPVRFWSEDLLEKR